MAAMVSVLVKSFFSLASTILELDLNKIFIV